MELAQDIFGGASSVMVKQEWAALEFCGCEAKNRYRVSQPQGRSEGNVFLYVSEESGCLERICCSVNRSLKLHVHQGAGKEGKVVQTMAKPFSCQGCCFLRPSFTVYGPSEEKIGTIEDPCRCCWMDQQVLDASGNKMFNIDGSPWQCGMFCPCCADVTFSVKKGDKQVADIQKMAMDCGEMCTKTNRFVINFSTVTDPVEKRMLFAAAMLLDLEYFEVNKNNN